MSNLNSMRDVCAVILAAGEGTRMRSRKAKVLHPLLGRPLVHYPVDLCLRLGVKRVLVVVCSQAEEVKRALAGRPVEFIYQAEPKGTAHALLQTEPALPGFAGTLLVLTGDTRLLRDETVLKLLEVQTSTGAVATLLTAEAENADGYGRILRDRHGRLRRIVEEIEATERERDVNEIDAGIYCFAGPALFPALKQATISLVKGEFSLAEVVQVFVEQGEVIYTLQASDPTEVLAINTRGELAHAAKLIQS